MIVEKRIEWNKVAYIAFIDLEKAFDIIQRERLWMVMEDPVYGINKKLIRIIRNMYENPINTVRTEMGKEKWFETKTGVRQGSVLSPLLFALYLDNCLKRICVRKDREYTFVYADDAAVVTKEQHELQAAVNSWNEVMMEWGMKINREKTEIMTISRQGEHAEIWMEGTQLKQTSRFKYLGVIFDEKGWIDSELRERITKYSKNVGMLYPLMMQRGVPVEVKVTIYTTILRPILLYGSECWVLNTMQKSKIEAAEMRVLRLIRGVTLKDRVRSEAIREELGVRPIIECIERNQLRWFGHVQRMEDFRYPRRLLNWRLIGTRPVGRPRKRWKDAVEEAITSRGETMENVERTALFEDRDVWRDFWRSNT